MEKCSNKTTITRQDAVKFYDEKINEWKLKKKEYLELDDFIHSEDIKKRIDALPDADSIRIERHCCRDDSPKLLYLADDSRTFKLISKFNKDLFMVNPYDEKGRLKKDEIKEWLSELLLAVHR